MFQRALMVKEKIRTATKEAKEKMTEGEENVNELK
jgi:hypothetical protein